MPWPQVEMVRIGEYHLCSKCTDLIHYEALHGTERSDRHERWRLHLSVGCEKFSLSGSTLSALDLEVEHSG